MTDQAAAAREAARKARHEAAEHLRAGYSDTTEHERNRRAQLAATYKPEHDAEADRLKTTIGDALPARVRMALGYHNLAREAAEHVDIEEN